MSEWTDEQARLTLEARAEKAEAEVARMRAHLEIIVKLTMNERDGTMSPGGMQARLALSGSDRPLERLRAEVARMRAALERLGSMEGFEAFGVVDKSNPMWPELCARIDYARAAVDAYRAGEK